MTVKHGKIRSNAFVQNESRRRNHAYLSEMIKYAVIVISKYVLQGDYNKQIINMKIKKLSSYLLWSGHANRKMNDVDGQFFLWPDTFWITSAAVIWNENQWKILNNENCFKKDMSLYCSGK